MRSNEPRRASGHRKQHQHQRALTNYVARQTHKAVGGAFPVAVKDAKEFSERPASFFLGPEKQSRKRRAERESVERGKHHGNRDGESKLLIQPPGDPRNEDRRHEHGGQDQGYTHNRAGKFLHRFLGGIFGRQPFLDVVLYAFDDHDGVVNHQSYGEHQPEQRKGIDGEAEQRKDGESSDQRDRHRQHGNQGGAPILQEEIDHKNYQHDRDYEGPKDFFHALRDWKRLVEGDGVIDVLREALLHLGHELTDALDRLNRVGSGQLIHGNGRARLTIQASHQAVVLRAQFDASHVFDANGPTVRPFAHDHVAELLW